MVAEDVLASVSYTSVFLMAGLAFAVGVVIGLVHRLVMDTRTPWHVPVIFGVGVVGLWLNTADTIVQFIEQTVAQEPLLLQNMMTNSVAIVASGFAAVGGARLGDQLAPNVRALSGATETDTQVNKIVRTIGRFITVTLPKAKDISDMEGYEPVSEETKDSFAGVKFLFPRGLTVTELHRRVVDRLRSDYGVGHVDLELDEAGEITHLAVGSRAAGIGPTLPPRQGAIAVQATPAPDASPGDRVHLWAADDDGARRVARAELRATNGDVATLVTDIRRIVALDQSETYDLVTLQSKTQPELEFASLLRAANETMEAITVESESSIAGLPVGALSLPIVAIRGPDRTLYTAPSREHVCEPDSTIYVIGGPDDLRKVRFAASIPETAPEGEQRTELDAQADRKSDSGQLARHLNRGENLLRRLRN